MVMTRKKLLVCVVITCFLVGSYWSDTFLRYSVYAGLASVPLYALFTYVRKIWTGEIVIEFEPASDSEDDFVNRYPLGNFHGYPNESGRMGTGLGNDRY
jgi:hypothetical protein